MNETMNDVTMTNKLTNNDMASNVTGPASSGSEGRSANPSVAMPRVVSIVGPTASGKTGLGIAVARALAERGERAEIVNADAYQMYRGMDIGTAKPTADEQAAVPHHLHRHHRSGRGTMSRRQIPAGSASHHRMTCNHAASAPFSSAGPACMRRAAIDDISFPGTDPDVRRRLEERERSEGAGALFDELRAKDPRGRRRAWTPATRAAPSARWRSSKLTGRTVFRQPAALPVRDRRPCRSGWTCPARSWTSASTSRTKQMHGGWVHRRGRTDAARIWVPPPGGRCGYQQSHRLTWTGMCDLDDTFARHRAEDQTARPQADGMVRA